MQDIAEGLYMLAGRDADARMRVWFDRLTQGATAQHAVIGDRAVKLGSASKVNLALSARPVRCVRCWRCAPFALFAVL